MNNKILMMFLMLLLSTLGAAAQNTITIGNADMEYLSLGQSVSLPVTMDNVNDIVAVEFIVKLPRGGSINPDGCQLNASRADGHQLSAACIDVGNNLYKVTAFSASNKPFKGSSGQLMTLDIVTSQSWLDGRTNAVTVTKALLCTSNGDNVCTAFENGSISIPITPHANIQFDVTGIATTVKKDSVNIFSLGIKNTGNASTGAITMQLPDWMNLQGALMPIEPGQTATAVIAMAPKGEAHTSFDGYIGVSMKNGNTQILPYNVTIVSDAKGAVNFSVCDEYTYYEADAPKVQNATIIICNSSTGEIVDTLNTGITGTATTVQPEGYYEYIVSADGHETYTNNILIYPGQTIERTVNLSLGDGIKIEYQVVETEDGDGYEIVTEATLEVAVPAPQVTISAPGRVKVSEVAVGDYVDIQVTLTNRGLIKARDVTLHVPEIEGFRWDALTPIVFDLRPQETSFITIRYTREDVSDEGCLILWEAVYTWKCGDEPKWRDCRAFTSIGDNCKPILPCNCTVARVIEDDVIVTVKLQFNQLLTLTRQAFEGTLTIENGSDKAMDDILLNLTEAMPNGELATDREFDISYTGFTGFSGGITGPWTLDSGKTGVLKVKFIPTKYAAPFVATDYIFGGNLTFSVDGKQRHADLTEQRMTVKPTPELNLDYFMQRDVIADDAITKDVVEQAEEAEFAVLISNIGYGDVENLRMVTAQPEMVDNEESLFLQYSITSSQLNGSEKSLAFGKSVTTDFGSLPAHGHAYAQWWMTSSLLGHFIEYNISYTQLTMSSNPNLSLLNEVRIHELIRSIVVEGNPDANYGFAVNGEEDDQNLPDTLYLTDGTTEPINLGQATTLPDGDYTYTLTLESGSNGWTYAKVADPTDGQATITEVIREDGTVVPLRNIWQTWATLVDKKRAIHENLIHIIDNCKSGTTTYTIRFTPKPAATLNIISVKLNGENTSDDVSVRNAEVQSVEIFFTDDIQQLQPKALALVNQGEVVDMTDVSYSIDGKKLTVDLSRIVHNDGFYCLTVNTALITDTDGHVGLTATPISWIEQTDKPVELNLAYNFDNAATVMVLAEEYHGVKTTYDTPQAPANKYKYGTTLTLMVTPKHGYIFNRWSIDGNILSTETTYEYYLSAGKELKLFFDRESFNLSVSNIVDDDEYSNAICGTVKGGGSGYYEYGEQILLTAEPEPCYKFVGWYTDDAANQFVAIRNRRAPSINGLRLLTTDPTFTYTVNGESKLYPVFHRMGDVNGDSKFTIADVVLVANYVKDGAVENFDADEADADNDGAITIADVEEIANSIKTNFVSSALQGDAGVTLTVPDVIIVPGDTSNVVIYFGQETPGYTAYQMDIAYPEGISSVIGDDNNPAFLEGDVYDTSHNVSSIYDTKGFDRFQCFSVDSKPFSTQNVTLLKLPIKAQKLMALGKYQATISPIEFVQADATPDISYAVSFNIRVVKSLTSIVTFRNEDGTLLQLDTLSIDAQPEYRGPVPSKNGTSQYSYVFAGWTPDITLVADDVTYTAVYDSVVNKYEITFCNEDKTVLQTDTLEYGVTPSYRGATPVKESAKWYTYTFSGWSPEIMPVTNSYTYTAVYDSLARVFGDVTDNRTVDIQDATIVVNYILGERSDNYLYYMADMNKDNEIDIFDVTAIVNVILGRSSFMASKRSSDGLGATRTNTARTMPATGIFEDVCLRTVSDKISLSIVNPERFTSFQMDVEVPDGAELKTVELAGNNNAHFVQMAQIGDNLYRVIALSMSSQPLAEVNSELVSFQIANTASKEMKVCNIMFVTPSGEAYYFNDSAPMTPTMLDVIPAESDEVIYDMSGRRIDKKFKDLDKGIYIINNEKVIIK